jgi:MFS family permease
MSDEEPPLKTNRMLMTTGFTRMFSNSLNHRFSNLLVTAAGASINQIGFLQGAKSLSDNLTQLGFGRLADRYGKKKFISAGQILNAFTIAALLFTKSPKHLIPLVILSSLFNGVSIPSWNSLLGDYTDEKTRGKIIGTINSISQLGSFCAMIIAILISINQQEVNTPTNYYTVLGLAAFASLISGILIWFTEEKPPIKTRKKLNVAELFKDSRLTRYLLLNFFYGVSMSIAWPFFPIIITNRLRMKIWQISSLSLTSSLIIILSQRRIGTMMDKIGRKPIIVFSRLIMALAPLTYVFAIQWWHLAVGEIFLGLGMAAWMTSESTYIIDLAPGELRATYLASSTAAFGVASFIGSNIGGYIVDVFFSGISGVDIGLFLSSALRVLFGLAYFSAYEIKKREQ